MYTRNQNTITKQTVFKQLFHLETFSFINIHLSNYTRCQTINSENIPEIYLTIKIFREKIITCDGWTINLIIYYGKISCYKNSILINLYFILMSC